MIDHGKTGAVLVEDREQYMSLMKYLECTSDIKWAGGDEKPSEWIAAGVGCGHTVVFVDKVLTPEYSLTCITWNNFYRALEYLGRNNGVPLDLYYDKRIVWEV